MTSRFVNLSLLGLLAALAVTGGLALLWSDEGWLSASHRLAAWALVALVPFKVVIAGRSYRRGLGHAGRTLAVGASSVLAGLTILVIVLAFGWMWRLPPSRLQLFGVVDTLMSWHWILGLALLPLFLVHTWLTWPRPRSSDLLSRRSFLRVVGVGAVALVGWRCGGMVAERRDDPASRRRSSGSRQEGSFAGNRFPVTSAAGDGPAALALEDWRLRIGGKVARELELDYEQALDLSATRILATLDCTVGWYTQQVWRGVRLGALLDLAGAAAPRWIRVTAHEGYAHTFAAAQAERLLLATHVGGEVLDDVHGYPLRLVAPGRKGWFWVKWVREVEVM